jgi:predicted RNase H-like HicB family nuclease
MLNLTVHYRKIAKLFAFSSVFKETPNNLIPKCLKLHSRQSSKYLEAMHQPVFKIESYWDEESEVWVASSDEIPGLSTEADTIEALMQKLRNIVPELLLLNQIIQSDEVNAISIEIVSHRQESIPVTA